MLTNPFEKFERKRFLYYSKDLSVISMNHALYSQILVIIIRKWVEFEKGLVMFKIIEGDFKNNK